MDKKLRVLLIDDDEDDRELFQIALDEIAIRCECITASGCNEAIKLLEKISEKPDYIFLDLNMPQVDGRECLRQLKHDIFKKEIPVIIYTTSEDERDREETYKMGAIEFITKPSKVATLSNVLENFFRTQLTPSNKS